VVLEHAWPQRRGAGACLHLDMDQRYQVGDLRPRRRSPRTQPQLRDEVELAFFALRRCQEQLLVQPVDSAELEALGPRGEETLEELGEELLQQHLQALVMIGRQRFGHARPPRAAGSGTDPQAGAWVRSPAERRTRWFWG